MPIWPLKGESNPGGSRKRLLSINKKHLCRSQVLHKPERTCASSDRCVRNPDRPRRSLVQHQTRECEAEIALISHGVRQKQYQTRKTCSSLESHWKLQPHPGKGHCLFAPSRCYLEVDAGNLQLQPNLQGHQAKGGKSPQFAQTVPKLLELI